MNIFHVNSDPKLAARDLCNEHVIKMILESAQMLCSCFEKNTAPYKRTHYNHPSTIWTRTSRDNFLWLSEHALELGEEHLRRYHPKKPHKSLEVVLWAAKNIDKVSFVNEDPSLTEFAQCMPDAYKLTSNPIQAYRNFYAGEKSKFATWQPRAIPPEWFRSVMNQENNNK